MSVPGAPAEDWRQLDRRSVLVTAVVMGAMAGGSVLPATAGLLARTSWAQVVGGVLAGILALGVAGAIADFVRWRRTRYRVGPERVELHTGLLTVKRRSLARERIRSVDLTAGPLLRVLGLVTVRIGTGEHTGGGESTLELDSVSKAEGERLRRELLAGKAVGADSSHREDEIAVLDLRWMRYAPASFVAPLLAAAAFGSVMKISEWLGVQGEVLTWAEGRFRDAPLFWGVVVLGLAALVVGVTGSLGLWVEGWSNYRLEREPGGTLQVRRGLLTIRSVTIEEQRLRGVELVEPLGVRLCGAARVDAIATGLVKGAEDEHVDHKTLLPAVPRVVAVGVAAQVLRETGVSPTSVSLTPHPRAARTRRLRWALAAALVPPVTLTVAGVLLTEALVSRVLLWASAASAAVLLPLAVLLALDAYRGLGHGVQGGYLVARSGTVRRGTVALQRAGVIGWTLQQSWFQRRAGLLTLTATTAAGNGAYSVYDADEEEGLDFASRAVPGLLEPFLDRAPHP
ncbi:PH domain-containing protein [Streptomyces sp. NPDC059176]|uniref:PH domain-containing protein n=1 Tax=Streptomyces sp. NPDC059176 TaxID=3346758 RepID=UPI0036C01915